MNMPMVLHRLRLTNIYIFLFLSKLTSMPDTIHNSPNDSHYENNPNNDSNNMPDAELFLNVDMVLMREVITVEFIVVAEFMRDDIQNIVIK